MAVNVKQGVEMYQDMLVRLFPSETNKKIRAVTFQVTSDCNLACTYCYQINKQKNQLTFDKAKRFIDLLLDNSSSKNKYLNCDNSMGITMEFIGGEPFLQIDLIDQITDYFTSQMILKKHPWATRHMISICSNGVLYFDPRVQAYLKKHQSNISFSISIDGNKELHDSCRVFPDGHGSYDTAIKAVKHFKETYQAKMGSKMTLAPENVMHTYDAVKSLIANGYDDIHLNCVYEEGWTAEHATILYHQLKDISDYMRENKLIDKIYVSMFTSNWFKPLPTTNDVNWCFRGDTMILTPNGHVRIDEIQKSDIIYSGTLQPKKALNVMSRVARDTMSIHATGVFKTFTTMNHPFLVKAFSHRGNGNVYRYKEPTWLPAGKIKKGDKIALPIHKFGNVHIDSKLAYIVGRYIGDGWHSTTGFKICCNYKEFPDLELALNAADIEWSYDEYPTVVQVNVFVKNKELIDILSECGFNAPTKKLPPVAFKWDKESAMSLLRGLYDADGSYYKDEKLYKFNTVSQTLANDVLLMVRSIGYLPTCHLCPRAGKSVIQGRTVNIRDRYEIYFSTDPTASRFCEYDEKMNVVWTTVRNVFKENPYKVYNLTVEDEHTFIANGIIVHNCGGDGNMISVDPHGDIFPCIRFMESSLGTSIEPIKIGNVYNGISTTEDDLRREAAVTIITRRSQCNDTCFNCPIATGCGWCTGLNYQLFTTPNKRATFNCVMHIAIALANAYHWNSFFSESGEDYMFKNYVPDEWALKIIDKKEMDILNNLSDKIISNYDKKLIEPSEMK